MDDFSSDRKCLLSFLVPLHAHRMPFPHSAEAAPFRMSRLPHPDVSTNKWRSLVFFLGPYPTLMPKEGKEGCCFEWNTNDVTFF